MEVARVAALPCTLLRVLVRFTPLVGFTPLQRFTPPERFMVAVLALAPAFTIGLDIPTTIVVVFTGDTAITPIMDMLGIIRTVITAGTTIRSLMIRRAIRIRTPHISLLLIPLNIPKILLRASDCSVMCRR